MKLFTVATSFILVLSSGRSLVTAQETCTNHDALCLTKKEPMISSLDNYSFNTIISNTGGSLFNNISPFNLTFAVSGKDASISTPYGTTLYYQIDDYNCDPNATESTSFQVSNFQISNNDSTVKTEKICYKAPPGYQIVENNLVGYKSLLEAVMLADKKLVPWIYAGPSSSDRGEIDLWMRQTIGQSVIGSPETSTLMATLVEDGTPVYYQTRYYDRATAGTTKNGINNFYQDRVTTTVTMDIFDFTNHGNDIAPNAVIDAAVKETCILPSTAAGKAETCQNDQSAKDRFQKYLDMLNGRGTGYYQTTSSYPSNDIPYEIIGDQNMVLNLDHFIPPMNNRSILPVQNQGFCGSCYSFSAAHVISSQYSQAHPGTSFIFSPQQAMQCSVMGIDDDNDENVLAGGAECFGGAPSNILNWLIATGSKMPLEQTVEYMGVQGTCDMSVESIDTGIKGYSTLKSKEEMKNAIYYRGDISILYNAGRSMHWAPSGDVNFPKFLGQGLSVPSSTEGVDHAVVVIGWGPCLVPEPDDENPCGVEGTSPSVPGECWIMQNSWGSKAGYKGFVFFNNDPKCDNGFLVNSPMIPIRDTPSQ
jgi:hypothetical protein